MTKKRLYLLLFLGILAGYGWLAWSWNLTKHSGLTPCIFKNATGMACPSCGTTTSVQMFLKGDITGALITNPLGIIVACILLLFPFWLLYDVVLEKDTLYQSYKNFEKVIKIKWIAITLIILIIINWAWNIQKGL